MSPRPPRDVFPLAHARPGERVRIVGAGRRLSDLGLAENAHAEVLSSGASGAVIVRVRASRLALCAGAAAEILVQRADQG